MVSAKFNRRKKKRWPEHLRYCTSIHGVWNPPQIKQSKLTSTCLHAKDKIAVLFDSNYFQAWSLNLSIAMRRLNFPEEKKFLWINVAWNVNPSLLIWLSQPGFTQTSPLSRTRLNARVSAELISLPWKIQININMARSVVFISMVQHPLAAPAALSFFKVDAKHSALVSCCLIVFK